MNETGSAQRILEWITLALAVIFVALGTCVVCGIFVPRSFFLQGTLKYVLGFVLIAYGIFRIGMITRKMKREKRKEPLTEKT